MNATFPILTTASVLILAGSASAQSYKAATHYLVGAYPSGVVAGDFDNDGDMDLAAFVNDPYGLTILENGGDAKFKSWFMPILPAGGGPGKLAVGDFNDDGWLDLAVTLPRAQKLSIVLNYGRMTFKPKVSFNIGAGAHGLAVADVNGDNRMDIAVANSASGSINILINRGRLSFKNTVLNVRGEPRHVAFGDVNNDGVVDLAVTNYSGRAVSVFGNLGRGGFTLWQTIVDSSLQPDAIAFADTDGDGDLDMVAAANAGGENAALVYVNQGGRFSSPARYDSTGRGAAGIVSVDFNLDGHFDLVTADTDSNSITLLRARGDGSFVPVDMYRTDTAPEDVIAVDLDGDGDEDLVTLNTQAKTVSLFLSNAVVYTR